MSDDQQGGGQPYGQQGGPAAGVWQPPTADGGGSIPPQYGQPPAPGYPVPAQGYPAGQGQPPAPYGYVPAGPPHIGNTRRTGICILLAIVTLGIYPIYYFYKVHDDMKRHTGNGLGGGLALVLALFVGVVMPYLTSSEVGRMYERRGQEKPVSGKTGLWYIPGILIIVGPIIWFVKTNRALNEYWASLGGQPA